MSKARVDPNSAASDSRVHVLGFLRPEIEWDRQFGGIYIQQVERTSHCELVVIER